MNDEDIALIQSSWNRLVGKEEVCINRFYRFLFDAHPEYESLFRQGVESQRLKFITMLNVIVNGLEHLDALKTPLAELGRKHKHLNINLRDYDEVTKMLIDAIDEVSPKPLSDMERSAWTKGLALVSSIMDKESRNQ